MKLLILLDVESGLFDVFEETNEDLNLIDGSFETETEAF
jgi:hypothetical protein